MCHSVIVELHQRVFEKCLDCVQRPVSNEIDSTCQVQTSGAQQEEDRLQDTLSLQMILLNITSSQLLFENYKGKKHLKYIQHLD